MDQFLGGKYFMGLLCITSLPTGFTNSPSEFQECMVFIFQDEIAPQIMNVFIDDTPKIVTLLSLLKGLGYDNIFGTMP
jgi:hypothetical protein